MLHIATFWHIISSIGMVHPDRRLAISQMLVTVRVSLVHAHVFGLVNEKAALAFKPADTTFSRDDILSIINNVIHLVASLQFNVTQILSHISLSLNACQEVPTALQWQNAQVFDVAGTRDMVHRSVDCIVLIFHLLSSARALAFLCSCQDCVVDTRLCLLCLEKQICTRFKRSLLVVVVSFVSQYFDHFSALKF